MKKIDYEVEDLMNYYDYKGLLLKSMKSCEQTLRLFIQNLNDKYKKGCYITRNF